MTRQDAVTAVIGRLLQAPDGLAGLTEALRVLGVSWQEMLAVATAAWAAGRPPGSQTGWVGVRHREDRYRFALAQPVTAETATLAEGFVPVMDERPTGVGSWVHHGPTLQTLVRAGDWRVETGGPTQFYAPALFDQTWAVVPDTA